MSTSLRAAGALAATLLALTACQSAKTTTTVTPGSTTYTSPTPVRTVTSKPTQPVYSQAQAEQALAEAGVIQCHKQPGADSECGDDPNPEISQAYPTWGFAGPSLDSYSGTYFKRSSAGSTDWTVVWAAGAGPFSCSGSYPVPTAVLKDMGGCF